MSNQESPSAVKLDVRAYPVTEPKSSTVGYASVTINDMVAITGIRVIKGEKGLFASMPSAKDSKGEYRDIAFPVTKELRQQLNEAVLNEYAAAVEKSAVEKPSVKDQIKGGAKAAQDKASATGKSAKDKSTPEH